MMNCEASDPASPEEFTRMGPLEKVLATKVLAHTQNLLFHLEYREQADNHFHDDPLRLIRESQDDWNVFKAETTSAEHEQAEIVWDIYQCQTDVLDGNYELMEHFAKNLRGRIPFEGLENQDVNWETLHSVNLTIQVFYLPSWLM